MIRVFSIPSGEKLFEFRRGMKRFVLVCGYAFNMYDVHLYVEMEDR